MNLIPKIFFAAIANLLFLCSCGHGSVANDTLAASAEKSDFTAEAEHWADSLLSGMTIEEKAGQLVMPASYTSADAATIRRIREYVVDNKIGGIVFLKGSKQAMYRLTAELRELSDLPIFVAVDAETGLSMRLSGGCVIPEACKLANCDAGSMYEYGARLGREASPLGINMVLGPVMDVARGGESVMFTRSYGSDAETVAQLGCAFGRGLTDNGVMAVYKHFPGHGATRVDSHKARPVITLSREEFIKNDILPFRECVKSGSEAIMVGHMSVPSLTGDSTAASLSPEIMGHLLRGELGFRGLILTDAVNMEGATTDGSVTIEAIKAGADIVLAPENTARAVGEIVEAVLKGEISVKRLDESVRRILFHKYAYRRELSL